MTQKLSSADRATDLAPLLASGWTEVDGRDALYKTFVFKNFVEAFGFLFHLLAFFLLLDPLGPL